MVAAASDARSGDETFDRLVRATGRPAVLTASDHQCAGGTHTRLDDGRRLCWAPVEVPAGWRYAVDAERVHRSPPPALAARSGNVTSERFWWLWTRAEARAKVHDIPILEWLRRVDWHLDRDLVTAPAQDLRAGANEARPVGRRHVVRVITVEAGDMVVSYAFAAPVDAMPPNGWATATRPV